MLSERKRVSLVGYCLPWSREPLSKAAAWEAVWAENLDVFQGYKCLHWRHASGYERTSDRLGERIAYPNWTLAEVALGLPF